MAEPRWPSRLVVVRHGQSKQNVTLDISQENLEELLKEQKETRDASVELTEHGIWQAEKTGLYLAETPPFDICFTSPYIRANDTAKAIVSQLEYELEIYSDERLREKESGSLQGYKREEILKKFPEENIRREKEGKYWYRPPNGENYPNVRLRVNSFLEMVANRWHGESVLLVTHQVPYKLIRGILEYIGEEGILALEDTPNCGMQEYVLDTSRNEEGKLKLTMFNKIAY